MLGSAVQVRLTLPPFSRTSPKYEAGHRSDTALAYVWREIIRRIISCAGSFVDMKKGRSGGAAFSIRHLCRTWQIFRRKISWSNQVRLGVTDYSMIFDTSLTVRLGITDYSMIFDTTPAPTVRPPSRMAKRRPSSIAIGAISSTVKPTLSPGITISVPSASVTVPVTSVVRK